MYQITVTKMTRILSKGKLTESIDKCLERKICKLLLANGGHNDNHILHRKIELTQSLHDW